MVPSVRASPPPLGAILGGAIIVAVVAGPPRFLAVVGLTLQVVFTVYFIRHLAFSLVAFRSAAMDAAGPVVTQAHRPAVSVLVACHDEAAVAERLVAALRRLRYPASRLQVLVIDDGSTDGTATILERAASGSRITILQRPPGAGGGKSGALNAALDFAIGEVVVVFDADHVPRRDCVERLARHFADPSVAAVQGRCEISNADDGIVARLIRLDYLAGYFVNEYGRQALFRLPAYGGANCAVRTNALRALGGWNPNTVTEDTDLTMRLVLAGHLVRYDVTAVDEEEAVVTLRRYWRQRYRWARGHQQVWRDYRRAAWKAPHLDTWKKVETTLFLLAFHVPVMAALGLVVGAAWIAGVTTPPDPGAGLALWALLFVGPLLELGAGLLISGDRTTRLRTLALFMPLYVVSMALCTTAWVDHLRGRPYDWVKTPRAAEPA